MNKSYVAREQMFHLPESEQRIHQGNIFSLCVHVAHVLLLLVSVSDVKQSSQADGGSLQPITLCREVGFFYARFEAPVFFTLACFFHSLITARSGVLLIPPSRDKTTVLHLLPPGDGNSFICISKRFSSGFPDAAGSQVSHFCPHHLISLFTTQRGSRCCVDFLGLF